MLINQMIIGTFLVTATVMIHAVALNYIIVMLKRLGKFIRRFVYGDWKVLVLTIAVLGTFLSHVVQIWIWASFYILVDAVPDFETALYFSTSSFTTVGFGDVVLSKEWRLLSSFQAANGFILFGWSTAFLFEVMYRLYESTPSFRNEK
jgi:voltage-gated potassium channel